jgi:asparagine synthase (glutamine-hydrolysing)
LSISYIIPSSITDGKKKGFSSPDASWFMNDSANFVKQRLITEETYLGQSFTQSTISRLVEEHFSGVENRRLLIWSLLSFNSLLRREQNIGSGS